MPDKKPVLNRFVKDLKRQLKPRKPAGSRKIFCIGLQKTGTTTFQKCMQALGYDHKGNSPELFLEWRRDNKRPLFDIIEKYDSFDDIPYFVLYRDIFDVCGTNALYVLTLRSSPQIWLDSMKAHALGSFPWTSQFEIIYGRSYPHGYEDEFIAFYEAHREGVREFFREHSATNNLCELCWENGQGWPELCNFLGRPIPDIPFPHARRRLRPDPQREVDNMVRASHQMLEVLLKQNRTKRD